LRDKVLRSIPPLSFFPELCECEDLASYVTLPNNSNGIFVVEEKFAFPILIGLPNPPKFLEIEDVSGKDASQDDLSNGAQSSSSASSRSLISSNLFYRCEYVVAMGRLFLEGVFSWTERFFVVSIFGVLHLYEKDYSPDILNVLPCSEPIQPSASVPNQDESGLSSALVTASPDTEIIDSSTSTSRKIPGITRSPPTDSIPLGMSFMRVVNPSQRIFQVVFKSKKLFERNKTYRFQCKTDDQMIDLLFVLKRYLSKG
jgi:hypothetical protein